MRRRIPPVVPAPLETNVYHRINCRDLTKSRRYHDRTVYNTIEEAVAVGNCPCQNCRPEGP